MGKARQKRCTEYSAVVELGGLHTTIGAGFLQSSLWMLGPSRVWVSGLGLRADGKGKMGLRRFVRFKVRVQWGVTVLNEGWLVGSCFRGLRFGRVSRV